MLEAANLLVRGLVCRGDGCRKRSLPFTAEAVLLHLPCQLFYLRRRQEDLELREVPPLLCVPVVKEDRTLFLSKYTQKFEHLWQILKKT